MYLDYPHSDNVHIYIYFYRLKLGHNHPVDFLRKPHNHHMIGCPEDEYQCTDIVHFLYKTGDSHIFCHMNCRQSQKLVLHLHNQAAVVF